MLFQSSLLFLAAFLGGTAVLTIPRPSQVSFQRINVLSGGYLFAITVLHLLPELFAMPTPPQRIGLYLLAGFFLQLFLELMSKGVEHGHIDSHSEQTSKVVPLSLLVALFIHAFLDGFVLSTPHSTHMHQCTHTHTHGPGGLLIGILLHKVPVAFAFTSVLNKELRSQRTVLLYLLLFAIGSPLGLWVSQYGSQYVDNSADSLVALFAIATGSFFHIATTIFFEASPGHHFNVQKFLVSLLGASLAIVFEFLL
ncbi:MAG: ZIP family metal transporter [Bacteroidota bacterium]